MWESELLIISMSVSGYFLYELGILVDRSYQ